MKIFCERDLRRMDAKKRMERERKTNARKRKNFLKETAFAILGGLGIASLFWI